MHESENADTLVGGFVFRLVNIKKCTYNEMQYTIVDEFCYRATRAVCYYIFSHGCFIRFLFSIVLRTIKNESVQSLITRDSHV